MMLVVSSMTSHSLLLRHNQAPTGHRGMLVMSSRRDNHEDAQVVTTDQLMSIMSIIVREARHSTHHRITDLGPQRVAGARETDVATFVDLHMVISVEAVRLATGDP